MNVRFVRAALVLCAGLAAILPAAARAIAPPAQNFLSQRMSGEQEVPPRETRARGVAVYNLSPDGTQLRFHLVVTNIQNVVAAHIHSGAPGVNGPIIFGMFDAAPAGGRHNGVLAQGTVIRGVTPLPPSLGATLTNAQRFDELIALMRSGNTYTNVHTNDGVAPIDTGPGDFPGGEVRGRISPKP